MNTTRSAVFASVAAVALGAAFLGLTCGDRAPDGAGARVPRPRTFVTPLAEPTLPDGANPIVVENARPGAADWRVTKHAGALLQAYAGEVSIAKGGRVPIHVSGEPGHTFTWRVLRLGWYAGAGARTVLSSTRPLPIERHPVSPPDPATALVACAWPESFAIETGADWTTGVHLVLLEREDGKRTYATFVLRDDERRGAAVVQIPVTTWQAYNGWGGSSLYRTSLPLVGGKAREVSYDRPYDEGAGAGQLFRYDEWFIHWAESKGFDLVYVTNVDFERDPRLLDGQRLFLSVGHDEYWTRTQREALARALEDGTSLAFLSANDAYWQIRLEPSRDAASRPHRTQVCYKDRAPVEDPKRDTDVITTRWRDPQVEEPENELLGVMYTDYQYVDAPWVVANADAWPYTGSGLADGEVIPLLVGYEADRVFDNGGTPDGLVVLAHSPIVTYRSGSDLQQAATYDTEHGTFVFAAGTIEWSWGLSYPGIADERVQHVTENVFRRAGVLPQLEGDTFGAGEPPDALFAGEGLTVELFAGTAGEEGLEDGPAAEALFRRPFAAAVDTAGNVYVTDNGNHAVRRIANDAARTVTRIAGTGSPGRGTGTGRSAALRSPTGIAVVADGSVIVTDTGNHRLVRLRERGDGTWDVEHYAGSTTGRSGHASGAPEDARFQEASGLAAWGERVFLADTTNNRICLLDSAGFVSTVVGGTRGHLDGPGAVAKLRFPTGVRTDGGSLWVVDSGNRLVRRVALDGAWTTTTVAGDPFEQTGFRDGPAPDARFMAQHGIAAVNDDVFVADTGNNRLRRIHGGAVHTLAGSGGARGGGSSAEEAALPLPTDVVPLPGGELLVISNGDSTLRVLRGAP